MRHRQTKGPSTAGLDLNHRATSRLYRADGTGARSERGALNAAEAADRFVDEPGGVGAGVVGEDLAPGVEDTDRDGIPGVVASDEPW